MPPAMVTAIGRQHGVAIRCETVAFPDFSLDDHLQRGEAARAIARGGWSFVVLQQAATFVAGRSQITTRFASATLE